ncbi:C3HC zinc finger-like-domain-containing protein [Sparassis latifolia]
MSQTTASTSTAAAPSTLQEKSFKRKLEDALHILDEAVVPSASAADLPPPAKKPRLARSLYSTLAKYGITKQPKPAGPTDELEKLSKTAPHLAAILSRTATRTRKALPFKLSHAFLSTPTIPASHSASEYRPSSLSSFLARLATFKLSSYSNKPPAIDAVAAAKCGWVNSDKDRLLCGICGVSWVLAGREGMNRDAANALVEKQRVQLVDMHKDGCPWKVRQCDPSIYRIHMQAPLAMAREIKSRAIAMEPVLQNVMIKHPLSSVQVQSLLSTISSVSRPALPLSDSEPSQSESISASSVPVAQPEPSETAVIASLFGWSVAPAAPPAERTRVSSISRANSVAPSSAVRAVPRSPSVSSLREGTATPSISHAPLNNDQLPSTASAVPRSPSSILLKNDADTTLLYCALCQRRLGLWSFLKSQANSEQTPAHEGAAGASVAMPKRQLDVLREHRPYCPYVVRSTVVPSLAAAQLATPSHAHSASTGILPNKPTSLPGEQGGAVEGWRAVLTVVLRHGMARRQRLGLNRATTARRASGAQTNESDTVSQAMEMEVDPVEAMVAGVKARGGKDLLRYVKGLLS